MKNEGKIREKKQVYFNGCSKTSYTVKHCLFHICVYFRYVLISHYYYYPCLAWYSKYIDTPKNKLQNGEMVDMLCVCISNNKNKNISETSHKTTGKNTLQLQTPTSTAQTKKDDHTKSTTSAKQKNVSYA